jgi:hypothetical protein
MDRLTDSNTNVRQAARRSLIILSFFTLRTEGIESSSTRDTTAGKPVIVDFGPKLTADKAGQEQAAAKWEEWWNKHGGNGKSSRSQLRTARLEAETDAEAARLSASFVFAPLDRQPQQLARYREEKGIIYTEAIADALPQLEGEILRKSREALAERLSRMTAATLRYRLTDSRAEVRRAAAIAWAMKDDRAAIPELMPLLGDPDDFVVRGVRAALKSLTGQDFGPAPGATSAERTAAITAWKSWWQRQPQ